MSRNNNTKNTNTKNTKSVSKPFCKICFDACKPESEYTSHYIRKTTDPNSAITCPILLATECRYCHQMGHTISRCTLREQNNRARDAPRPAAVAAQAPVQARVSSTRPVAVAAPVARQSNSRFAALDDDEEETVTAPIVPVPASLTIATVSAPQPVNLFPSLSAKVAPISSNSVARVSYSSAFKSSDAPSTWKLRIVPTVEVEEVIEEYDSDDDEVYEKTVTVKVSVPVSSTIAPASSPVSSPTAKPKVIFSCLDIFNKSLSKKVAPLKKLNTYAENKVEPEEYFVQEEDKLDYATERYLAKFEVKKPTYAEKINPVLSRSYHYDNPYYNYDW